MITKFTRTHNRLHFSDLNPTRFEDLCLHLLSRSANWKVLNHFGRTGKDDGIDIHGIEIMDDSEKTWFIQCKRYAKITKRDIESIITDAIKNGIPDKLLLITSADISKGNNELFTLTCQKNKIIEFDIWSASDLETMLYNDHKDLLFIYFGLNIQGTKNSNESRIKYSIRMGKKMQKDFINHSYIKENFEKVLHNPRLKFISDRVIIHSTNDSDYPGGETPKGQISSWFRVYLYDFYHNGIELWLGATLGNKAIFDKNGFWEPINCFDKRKDSKDYKAIDVKMIGRIPFYNIVDYKIDGDEYYQEPHIYCRFEFEGEPYEKIYYRQYGNPDERIPDYELDEEKKTVFPEIT